MNEPRSKIIISPINNRDWTRTIDTFEKQARKKGVTEEIISDLVDMLDLNHEKILDGINKETASDNSNSKSLWKNIIFASILLMVGRNCMKQY